MNIDTSDFRFLLDVLLDDDYTSKESSVLDDDSCAVVVKPKRKRLRVRNRPVYPKPNIVKNDIRLSYLSMITNVLNTGDFVFLYGLMHTFLTPNATSCYKTIVGGELLDCLCMSFSGFYQSAQQWCNNLTVSPDGVFKTSSFSIDYNTGKIVGKMQFVGTRMYEDASLHEFMKLSYWNDGCDDIDEHRDSNSADPNSLVLRKIMRSVERMSYKLIPRNPPLPYTIDMTFTLMTDAEKRITSLDLVSEC